MNETAIAVPKFATIPVITKSKLVLLKNVRCPHQRNARVHGMNGDHAMQFVELELDRVIANVYVALQVVQAVMKICPKKRNVRVMIA